jgi:hypothetical protein
MNVALALPASRRQKLNSGVLSRLRTLVVTATDRRRMARAVPRPYSFLSECECPHDCLRDHENE